MATTSNYGANYTVIINTPVAPADLVHAHEWGGNVRVQADSVTITAGAGDAGSFIYIGNLPQGSIPLCCVLSTAATVTWTGTVGWSGNADGLGDFPAFGAGSVVTGPGVSESYTALTQDTDIYITTATAALVSADTLATQIFYVSG